MGRDKGSIPAADGKTWAQRAVALLEDVCPRVVVSVNRNQLTVYHILFDADQLIADDAQVPVQGPLLGLLSAHRQFPGEDLLLLACDMAHMEKQVVQALLEAYRLHPGREAYLFLNEGVAEPLCAVYTAPALARLLEGYCSGQHHRWSMKYALSGLQVRALPLPTEWKPCFANINTQDELPSGG